MNKIEPDEKLANGGQDPNKNYTNPNDGVMQNMTPLQPIDTKDTSSVITTKKDPNKSTPDKTFHELCKDGDVNEVRSIITSYVTDYGRTRAANYQDAKRNAPLHYAAEYNHIDVAQVLVQYGAILDAKGEGGRTPLHFAVMFIPPEDQTSNENSTENIGASVNEKSLGMISFLIKHGANINGKDGNDRTPLQLAVLLGNERACEQLLEEMSSEKEVQYTNNNTPLHIAVSHRRTRIIKLLIEAGTNIRTADKTGSTPLHICCTDDDGFEIAKMYLELAKHKHGKEEVRQLMQDIDVEGNTCLCLAVNTNNYEITKLCIKNGADVNTANASEMYPLHIAATNGNVKVVKLLLKNDAQVDAINRENMTPLCKAIQFSHAEVVGLLIKKGADIEKRVKKKQYTPLLLACCTGSSRIVERLLRGNADVTAVDDDGKTGIFLATERNHLPSMQALYHETMREMVNKADENDNTPLHVAAENGFVEALKSLLKQHAEPNSKNWSRKTPLHSAAKHGKKEVVKPLVLYGGQLRAKDEDSNTPLHVAALHGHAETVSILIEQGADIEAENRHSWRPLHFSADNGWIKTARVLLEAEAAIDVTIKTGLSPLHLAAKNGHADIIELLLSWGADIRLGERLNKSCLDLAIENHKSKAAIAILNSENWKDALRNFTLGTYAAFDTPMRKLIKEMPDVAKMVLDKCTYTENLYKPGLYEFQRGITFNYEFMDDAYFIDYWLRCKREGIQANTVSLFTRCGSKLKKDVYLYVTDNEMVKNNHPLTIMVSCKRENLLQHPLITALLRRKWQSWTNKFFYVNYMMYITFLVFITGYLVSTTPPYVEDLSVSNITSLPSYCDKLDASGYDQPMFAKIGKYIVTILACWNLLREIFQMYQAKLSYISWENLIELVTYICAIMFVNDFEECQRSTGYRYVWQWNVGTVAVLLAWINLVLFSQKFLFGLYVVMLKDIISTFLRFFLLFMLLIVGFALAFFATLQNQKSFTTVWQSLVKTTVMMIGEFEYDDIFTNGDVDSEVIGYLLFYVFMILMTIIVMNLMVGLAVDNIKGIQDQAELTRKGMQIELALDIESLWPDIIRRQYVCLEETIVPQFGKPTILQRILGVLGIKDFELTAESIKNSIDPAPTEVDELRETVTDIQRDLKEVKADLKDVKEQFTDLKQVKDMLAALVKDRDSVS